jgi:hypothetical protein
VNSELAKRQEVLQRRVGRLEQRAQACRVRLARLLEEERTLHEQLQVYEPRSPQLFVQVRSLEAAGSTEEPAYFPIKAPACATDWQVRRCKARLDKNAGRRQRQMDTCEAYCRELRQMLRQQADLQAQARAMFELDHAKDQIMTLFKLGLANLGMWVRDTYFAKNYHHCGWQRLWPFFKLGGAITKTAKEVHLDVCAFNNRALVRD